MRSSDDSSSGASAVALLDAGKPAATAPKRHRTDWKVMQEGKKGRHVGFGSMGSFVHCSKFWGGESRQGLEQASSTTIFQQLSAS